jgi:hypothetical protein
MSISDSTKKSVMESGKLACLALSGQENATVGSPEPSGFVLGTQTGRSKDAGLNAVGTNAFVERIWFVQLGETASISLMLHTESAMKFMESTLPGQLTSVWVL